MKTGSAYFTTALAVLLVTMGCDDKPASQPAPPSQTTSAPPASQSSNTSLTYNCILTGQIKYKGPKPPTNDKPILCHPGANLVVPNEAIVSGPDGELKNAVVFVSNAPHGEMKIPLPVVIDQKDCIYVPHVVAAQVGQTVNFTSADPVPHNVHILAANQSNSSVQQGETVPFIPVVPEFIKSKCDVHPWMSCWIAVFDHPYFAVTADDGTFTIPNLPPGQYTMSVWQEKLGIKTQPVTLTATQSTTANLTFTKP